MPKSVTVRMTEAQIQALDDRVNDGGFKNRSDLMRYITRRYCEGTLIPIRK